jgi:general stress protein 26
MTNSLKYGVLSTAHPLTTVASRTIQPFEVEFNDQGNPEIYFNTNKYARKVPQLEANQDVTLAYLDQNRMCCVTYTGKCERMPYPESTRHWRDWLWVIFPEGNDESQGSRFTTWRVRPHTINYVNLSEGIVSSRYDGRPPEIVLPHALPPADPMHRDLPENYSPSAITTNATGTTTTTTTTTATATATALAPPQPSMQWVFRDYGDDVKPSAPKK